MYATVQGFKLEVSHSGGNFLRLNSVLGLLPCCFQFVYLVLDAGQGSHVVVLVGVVWIKESHWRRGLSSWWVCWGVLPV